MHITPEHLDKLAFYRVEEILEAYKEIIDEEKKAQESDQNKLPQNNAVNYGGYNVPKVDIPKINIPQLNIPKM